MPFTSISPDGLADSVAGLVCARAGRVRVLLDGPPPAGAAALAERVAQRLRAGGRATVVVAAGDFLRPASVRLEFGHTDPDAFLDGWLDEGALRREVLDPAGQDGSGRVLPRLWNLATDRAYRAGYVELPSDGVVLLAGALLLGRGLPAEVVVHMRMGPAALARALPTADHWTLPAYERYEDDRGPREEADVLVMADHPDRPAVRV